MPKQIADVKTHTDLVALFRELGATQLTALNGLLEKVPGNLKAEYEAMRDRLNGLLAKLPPLDQVPASQDASWALNSFARTITELFEYMDVSWKRIDGMAAALADKTTALNGLTERVTKGELLDKATTQAAVDSAVTAAVAPFKAEIAAMRKSQVALCKLPEAPDAVLNSQAEAFAASLAQAQQNLAVCTQRGFAVGGKGDAFVKKTVWLDATAFQGENQTLDDLAESLKVKIPAGGDPFVGGTSAAAKDGQTATTPSPSGRKLTFA